MKKANPYRVPSNFVFIFLLGLQLFEDLVFQRKHWQVNIITCWSKKPYNIDQWKYSGVAPDGAGGISHAGNPPPLRPCNFPFSSGNLNQYHTVYNPNDGLEDDEWRISWFLS